MPYQSRRIDLQRLSHSDFITQLQHRNELVLRKGEQFGTLNVHFLALQHLNEAHLLLKCLHELIPLLFKPPIVLDKLLHVPANCLALALLAHFCLSELVPRSLQLLQRPIQLCVLGADILILPALLSLSLIQIPLLLLEIARYSLKLLLQLCILCPQLLDLDSLLLDFLLHFLDLSTRLLILASLVLELYLLQILLLNSFFKLRLQSINFGLLHIDYLLLFPTSLSYSQLLFVALSSLLLLLRPRLAISALGPASRPLQHLILRSHFEGVVLHWRLVIFPLLLL